MVFYITAFSGSILELYRQIVEEFGIERSSNSRVLMISIIKNEIREFVVGKKIKTVLIIDEASLLRMEVFAELHTLVQFEKDSKAWLPVILAGQPTLVDKLQYRTSIPFSSRIVAKVIYTSKDRKTRKVFTALDWLARLVTHIPSRDKHTVRYYGYFSKTPPAHLLRTNIHQMMDRILK